MSKTFTSKKNLSPLISSEQDLLAELNTMNKADEIVPDQFIIDNILNYSKALSIRKTKSGTVIETILN